MSLAVMESLKKRCVWCVCVSICLLGFVFMAKILISEHKFGGLVRQTTVFMLYLVCVCVSVLACVSLLKLKMISISMTSLMEAYTVTGGQRRIMPIYGC